MNAIALSGLKGFPRLYGWGEVDGVPVIVMEWVEGETLAACVRDLPWTMPAAYRRLWRRAWGVTCSICSAA